jgi:hypothetical protein
LVVTFFLDDDTQKVLGGIKKLAVNRVKKVKKFTIGNEHCTVLGLTQHGKTYGLIKTLDSMNEPILFFNTNDTSLKESKGKWIEGNGGHSIEQLLYALKKGYKVNFIPSDDVEGMEKQLGGIVKAVYQEGRFSFRFAIDEVHLFRKEGKQALIRLASTGLGRGYKCVFISQRGAMVDNTLLTQSTKHILFALGLNDYSYLKTNGFPSEDIKEKTGNEKYKFVEFDQKEVNGPFIIE